MFSSNMLDVPMFSLFWGWETLETTWDETRTRAHQLSKICLDHSPYWIVLCVDCIVTLHSSCYTNVPQNERYTTRASYSWIFEIFYFSLNISWQWKIIYSDMMVVWGWTRGTCHTRHVKCNTSHMWWDYRLSRVHWQNSIKNNYKAKL